MQTKQDQIKMYGMTVDQIEDQIIGGHPLMFAAGILSDIQEITRGNVYRTNEEDIAANAERVRQMLNVAKKVMFDRIKKEREMAS